MKTLQTIAIISLICLLHGVSVGQVIPGWKWAKQSKGYSSTGYALAVNNNKDTYLSCIYQDSAVIVDRYKFNNNGYSDAMIIKYDSCGNVKWAKAFGGEGAERITSMATDSEDNLYVAGVYSSLAFRIDNVVIRNSNKTNNYENFIAKFNSEGRLIWVNTINGERDEGYPSIAINSRDELLVSGWTSSKVIYFANDTLFNTSTELGPPSDIFLINFDKEGRVIWSKIFGGNDYEDNPYITIDKLDNIYVAGHFTSMEFEVDSIRLPNRSVKAGAFLHFDIFLIKLDDIGNVIWGDSFGGDKDEYVNSITVDKLNNVYINGLFEGPKIKFDDSIYTISRNNVFDNFALKLNSNGNIIWSKIFVANNQSILNGAIQVDDYLNVYITGQIYFPGIKVDSFQRTNNFRGALTDVFLIKLDSNANLNWGTSIGSNFVENVTDIKVIDNDELVITGHFASDTLQIGNHTLLYESKGGFNYFVAKLGGQMETATHQTNYAWRLDIFPNPARDRVVIRIPEPLVNEKKLQIKLVDQNGKEVNCNVKKERTQISMEVSELPKGLYMLSMISQGGTYVQRLIVN